MATPVTGADNGPARPPEGADKHALRAFARKRRAALMSPRDQAAERSIAVVRGIVDSKPFIAARTVLTYLAFGSEVDLAALSDVEGKRFAVPLTHAPDSLLTFHLLAGADLLTSRSGLRQPLAAAPQVALAEVDLVLVPGLAFDVSGARLGYGKGFYDRFLAQLAALDADVPTVGVTLDDLVLDALPVETHDVKMTHLATEAGVEPVSHATAGRSATKRDGRS